MSEFDDLAGLNMRMRSYIQPVHANRHELNPVSWMHERLLNYIQEFEKGLSENEEIGAQLVSFGHEIVFHIVDIGFHGPDMITFYGIHEDGRKLQLIQHMSQLSVLFMALPVAGEKPRRIGVRQPAD